ncbi:hypothetical protein D3C78_835740 [compost metagenome]
MAACGKAFTQFLLRRHGTYREAAAKSLGHREDIRLNAIMLMSKQLACTAYSRLNFIHDKQYALLLTQRCKLLHVILIGRVNTAFGLHHLQHNCSCVLCDCSLKRCKIIKRNGLEAFRQRSKAFLHLILASGCQSSKRTAMERLLERNDFIAAVIQNLLVVSARQLDRSFVRFSARIAEKHRVSAAIVCNELGCLSLIRNTKQIGYMPQLIQLLNKSFFDLLWGMPKIGYGNSAHKIKIFVPLVIPKPASFALYQSKRISCVCRKQRLVGSRRSFRFAHHLHLYPSFVLTIRVPTPPSRTAFVNTPGSSPLTMTTSRTRP